MIDDQAFERQIVQITPTPLNLEPAYEFARNYLTYAVDQPETPANSSHNVSHPEIAVSLADAREISGLPLSSETWIKTYSSALTKHANDANEQKIVIFNKIGLGHFGCVLFCIWNQHLHALKVVAGNDAHPKAELQQLRELLSGSIESHRNLIRVHLSFIQDSNLYLVMDFADGGKLSDILGHFRERNMHIQLSDSLSILLQLARALRHLHQQGVIHRDVKPDNILFMRRNPVPFTLPARAMTCPASYNISPPVVRPIIDAPLADFRVKLGDFGLLRACQPRHNVALTIGAGTKLWMAPEVLNRAGVYDRPVDIYSWGMVALETLSGHPASKFRPKGSAVVDPRAVRSSLPPSTPPKLAVLVQASLEPGFERRPTAEQLVYGLKTIATEMKIQI